MSSFHTIRLIAVREMRERLRNRTFIISNVVTIVILLAVIIGLPLLFSGDGAKLAAVDVPEPVQGQAIALASALGEEVEFVEFDDVSTAEMAIFNGDVSALLIGTDELVTERSPDPELVFVINEATADVRFAERLDEAGVTEEQAAVIAARDEPIALRSLDQEEENFFNSFGAASVSVVLLFMAITIYGGTVLTGVLEEKTSRVIEVVMSTVRPWQLLAGKVTGLGLLGLGQLAILVGLGLMAAVVTDLTEVPATAFGTAAWVVVWFVLGFAFYSVLYAMGGALAGRLEDAQSTAAPVGFLLLAGYLLSFVAVLPNPDGAMAKITSVLPPFAPFSMPALIAFGEADLWQIILSPLLMVIAIIVIVRLAGRVYAGAVLHAGEKLKIRDAWRRAEDLAA
jgi:ABC-2 type transport system permease protein